MALNEEINQNILGSVQSKAPADALSVEDMQGHQFNLSPEESDAFDQYQQAKYGNPSTGALSNSSYYPNLNDNVAVGSYSGSQIGNTTLFAPGAAVVPLGMLDARDLAVQKAAMQKMKDVEDFKRSFKAPTSKLVNINDNLREGYFKHIDDSWKGAMKAAGGDANKAAYILQNNPEFHQREKSFQDLAKYGDDIVTKTAQDEQDIKTGKFTPTPTYKALKDKLYKAADPNSPEFKDLGNVYRTMQVERDFSDAFNDVTKKMVASETGYAGADLNDPEFIKIYKKKVKEWSPEQKAAVASTLSENIYHGSDYFTPEKVKKDVNGLLSGVQTTKDVDVKQTRAGSGDDDYTENDISKEPSNNNVYTSTGKGNAPNTGNLVGDYGVTHKKEIKATIPTGRTVFINDDKNGLIKSGEVNPNADTKLFKTELVKVLDGSKLTGTAKEHDGTPQSEEQIKDGRPWKWAVMTKGVITEGTGDEKTQKEFLIPSKEVENALVKQRGKDGSVIKGIPVDKLYSEADKRNAEISKSKTPAAATKNTAGKKTIKGF